MISQKQKRRPRKRFAYCLLLSKWQNIKVVFRYAETFDGLIVKPQFPNIKAGQDFDGYE